MESVRFAEIVRAIRAAGLGAGDIVNVHSRLFAIGRLDGARSTAEIPGEYLRAFVEALGGEGTIVVPTYTTAFARFGAPFVLEDTPSEMGVFSERVRREAGARRTLHPVQSLAALGPHARALADGHPRWNVGHDTIWDRMLGRGAKFVGLGIPPHRALSFMHQVEFLACVPYLYHKILRGGVVAGGARVEHDFLMAVRYLGYGVAYDLSRLEEALVAERAVARVPLGGSALWVIPLEAAFEVGMRGLRRDPYYLLREAPAFVDGEIPCDGVTIEREGVAPRYFLV